MKKIILSSHVFYTIAVFSAAAMVVLNTILNVDLPFSLFFYCLYIGVCSFFAFIGMIINRLLSTNWGRFFEALKIYYIIGLLNYTLMIFFPISNSFILHMISGSISFIAGLILFIKYRDKLISFEKVSDDKTEKTTLEITYLQFYLFTAIATLFFLLFKTFIHKDLEKGIYICLGFFTISIFSTIFAMSVKRLKTTLWGNFFQGSILFAFLLSLNTLLFTIYQESKYNAFHIFFYCLVLTIGSILFTGAIGSRIVFVKKRSAHNRGIFKIIIPFLKNIKDIIVKIIIVIKDKVLFVNKLLVQKTDFKKRRKIIIPGFILIIVCIITYKIFFSYFTVYIESYTPKGEIPLKANITMKFSEKIDVLKEDIETLEDNKESSDNSEGQLLFIKSGVKFFKITPELSGKYLLKEKRSIVFIPDQELKPSTEYRVDLIKKRLQSDKFISGKAFKFNTPAFKVTGSNLFYNYDILKNLEKEVVGELNFNAPVDIKELTKYTTMQIDSKIVKLSIEPSNIPTRFYLKSGAISRKGRGVDIKLTISSDLNCINGTIPLKKDYVNTIFLPEKTRLEVDSVKAFPVVGNTFIAIKFNMPVSSKGLRGNIQIIDKETRKNIPYTVQSEYCYSVLKGKFIPNREYEVLIHRGLKSRSGKKLVSQYEQYVSIKDLPPEVIFENSGKILPLKGDMNIKVLSLNLDRFNVKIDKVFRNNIVHFLQNIRSSQFSRRILDKSVEVKKGELNKYEPHYINLKKIHHMEYKGLYKVALKDNKHYDSDYYEDDYHNVIEPKRTQYILCTDIGIIAKESGKDLIVDLYSIMELNPIGGAKVKVISYDNQQMLSGVTTGNGTITFRNWRAGRLNFTPFIITAERGDDYSFLKFNSDEINLSRFNIGGEYLTNDGLKAFLTPERGVYRPGDKAFITTFIRKSNLQVPAPLSLVLYITDPTGEKFKVLQTKSTTGGTALFELSIPTYAKTGEYSLRLKLNDNIVLGSTSIKVEDFIPDKIKASIKATKKSVAPGKPVLFTVKGVQLFGPPAVDRKVISQIRFTPRQFNHPGFPGYSFLNHEKEYHGEMIDLGESKLNHRGEKAYSVDIPTSIAPPSALMAKVYTEVYDDGGRPVSAVKNIPVNYYPYYLGLKVKKQDLYLKNRPVDISYISITPEGKYKPLKGAKLLIKHKVYYTMLRKYGWFKEKFESESYEEIIEHKEIDIKKIGKYRFTPKTPGEYSIYVYHENGMKTSKKIYVQGTGAVGTNLESSENLIIKFNKEKYNIGDTATVNIHSPIPGKLMLNIVGHKVLYSTSVKLINKKATLSLPVLSEYMPGVYLSAMVIRKPHAKYKNLPMSSVGVRTMKLNKENKTLDFKIKTAAKIKSTDGLQVSLNTVPDSDVVITAVDEGILQITQFRTPEPFNYFYKKKALRLKLYSIFDAVLPNIKALKMAIGGDEGEYDLSRRHLNPIKAKRVKSLALHSGILRSDENGNISHNFELPEFNGKVRIMVMGAKGDRFGSASQYLTVSDPIVLTPSYPRMLAPGDEFQIPVRVYNKTGKVGKFNVSLDIKGPVKVIGKKNRSVRIINDNEKKITFYVKADKNVGKAIFKLIASGGGESGVSTVELPVRPARSMHSFVKFGEIKPGKIAKFNLSEKYIKHGQRLRITLSPNFLTQYITGLEYLIKYPYGCAEQTTSKVFPLLYLKPLIKQTGVMSDQVGTVDAFINEGIRKLESMQRPDGKFSYWQGGDYYNQYVSNYVSHFLIEAERSGYYVDKSVMEKIYSAIGVSSAVNTGRLDRRENYSWEKVGIYTLYLKALAGKPDRETMEYIKNKRLNKLDFLEKCRLASAYGLIGDRNSAKQILPSEFKVKYFSRSLGGSFSSYTRRLALYLLTLNDVDPSNKNKYDLARELVKYVDSDGHFGTTQENVFALMGLAKTFAFDKEDLDVDMLVNGQLYKNIDSSKNIVSDNSLSGKSILLKNKGSESAFYNVIYEGTPFNHKATPQNNGIKVERNYYNSEGDKLNLSNVELGQIVVATIKVKSLKKKIDNLVVVDLLPAGFEVENVRLRSRGKLGYEPPHNWVSAYEDIRDDRMLLFTGAFSDEISYSYTLRAVAVGKFAVPQVYAEAMYDPEVFSTGKSKGTVRIVNIKD